MLARTTICVTMGLLVSGEIAARSELIYAFRNHVRPEPIRMLLVGEIRSKVKVPRTRDVKSPYLGYDTRLDQVTVKVVDRKGLKVGQTLYVIDKNPYHRQYRNGLIAGEIRVRSIFYHPFFGWVLTGTGILLRVREGMFVARTLETEKLERAFERKKRGDFYLDRGELEKAVASYHSALEADRGLPEAHAALGRIYLRSALERRNETPVRAMAEMELAWRSRANFRYPADHYQFLVDYLETMAYARRTVPRQKRLDRLDRNLARTLEVAREALRLKPKSVEARYQQARAHFELITVRAEQARRLAVLADRLTKETPRHSAMVARYQERLKQSRRADTSALKVLAALLDESISDGRVHALAFRIYDRLRSQVRATASPEERNRLLALANYGPNFVRWVDVRYSDRASGVERLERLLLYHGEQYFRYARAGRELRADTRDVFVEERYRELRRR